MGVESGEFGHYQPAGAIAMSYDDLKVIEAGRLVRSILTGSPVGATIHDAVIAADLVDAMLESVETGTWTRTTG